MRTLKVISWKEIPNSHDNAFQKVRSLSRDMAVTETVQSNKKLVPYMITYNPFIPNIGEIINTYWGLLALSEKTCVKHALQHKPILAFKRPQNLGDILTHSKMNFSQNPTGSVSACKKRWCTHCKTISESDNFSSTSTGETFLHKQDFNCTSENVIYLIQSVKSAVLRGTHTRRYKKEWIWDFALPWSIINVSVHFKENGHSVNNFSFTPIDRVKA